MLWRQVVSRRSSLLCVDTVTQLRPGADTDLGLVISICDIMPDVTHLRHLDLQPWSCSRHKLLSNYEEFRLMFLPHLNSLALTDVDMETLVNVSCFCPQLLSLAISKSEVCHTLSQLRSRQLSRSGWSARMQAMSSRSLLGFF